MNEQEKNAVEKFEKIGLKSFREDKVGKDELLSYIDFVIILNLIEKQQKEIELKDKIIEEMAKDIIEAESYIGSTGLYAEFEGASLEYVINTYTNKVEESQND